jgi:hypothetical protein
MNIKATTTSILNSLEKYREFLEGMDDEEFQRSPAEGVWSYSEVYSHIISADTGCIIAIERCMYEDKSSTGPMKWLARLILFTGVFPPWKLKAPEKVAAMVKKINLEEARNGIIKLRERLPEAEELVRKSAPHRKVRHPRLGLLNAKQWLRFIEVHTLHHLKQLERIKRMLEHELH